MNFTIIKISYDYNHITLQKQLSHNLYKKNIKQGLNSNQTFLETKNVSCAIHQYKKNEQLHKLPPSSHGP